MKKAFFILVFCLGLTTYGFAEDHQAPVEQWPTEAFSYIGEGISNLRSGNLQLSREKLNQAKFVLKGKKCYLLEMIIAYTEVALYDRLHLTDKMIEAALDMSLIAEKCDELEVSDFIGGFLSNIASYAETDTVRGLLMEIAETAKNESKIWDDTIAIHFQRLSRTSMWDTFLF